MATSTLVCSVEGCKRAVACLCRHCQKDVCSKHFNEHQIQVNNQLIPITDRLNELKMRLRIDENDRTSPLGMLQTWREKKYEEIDEEYNQKVDELKEKMFERDKEITQTITYIQGLLDEGDVSIDQVKQIQDTIENLTNKVNNLLITESKETNKKANVVGKYVTLGGIRYLIKEKVLCQNTEFYALESEKALIGYNGLCPMCNRTHVSFEPNRGMYALVKTLQTKLSDLK